MLPTFVRFLQFVTKRIAQSWLGSVLVSQNKVTWTDKMTGGGSQDRITNLLCRKHPYRLHPCWLSCRPIPALSLPPSVLCIRDTAGRDENNREYSNKPSIFLKYSINTDIYICMTTQLYEYMYAYSTSKSTSERLNPLDLEIHEVGHQEHLAIDGTSPPIEKIISRKCTHIKSRIWI
jgi:hypothetical protein